MKNLNNIERVYDVNDLKKHSGLVYPENEIKQMRNLWLAVVQLTLEDAQSLCRSANNHALKHGKVPTSVLNAMDDLCYSVQSNHFKDCCDNAEVSYEKIINIVHSTINSWNFYTFPFFSPLTNNYHKNTAKRVKKEKSRAL